jgi:serine/threonine protein kinase
LDIIPPKGQNGKGNLEPYLGDFGFARQADFGGLLSSVGTPNYVAPEIIAGNQSYTSAVDVWSFGMLIYHARMGREPYSELGDAQRILAAVEDEGAPPLTAGGTFTSLYTECTRKNEEERPTMEEVGAQLLQLGRAYLDGEDLEALLEYDQRIRTQPRTPPTGTVERVVNGAQMGSRGAMTSYGWMLYSGVGMEKNEDIGLQWLVAAKDRQSVGAEEVLTGLEDDGVMAPEEYPAVSQIMNTFSGFVML